jgi:hypothetical protein
MTTETSRPFCGHCGRTFRPTEQSPAGTIALTHCLDCRAYHLFLTPQKDCPACAHVRDEQDANARQLGANR